MVIKMILRKIGKHRRLKVKSVYTALVKRVRRYLHYNICAAFCLHKRKKRIKLISVRRGIVRCDYLIAYHILDSSDKTDLISGFFYNLL